MFVYRAFGLCIHSEVALPLDAGAGSADVRIRIAELAETAARLRAEGLQYRVGHDETCLIFRDHACYVVRTGSEVLLDPATESVPTAITLALLGPVMAALLQQRGYLLLHASAVAVEGGAVAFLGASGWGKSTLAAALHARGFPLVVDDIVAVRFEQGVPQVYPGFPQFKLWPDTLEAMGEDPDAFPRLYEKREKRSRRIAEGFHQDGVLPLRRIYLLAQGSTLELEPLTRHEAFLQVAAHSFGIQWLHEISGPAFFHHRAQLVSQVPIRLLKRPFDLQLLPRVVEQVLADLGVSCTLRTAGNGYR